MKRYERIEEEHRELRLVRDRLRALIAAPAATLEEPQWHALWAREMELLQDLLVVHFQTEEEGGFMVEVLAARPNQTGKVKKLLAEHEVILARVDQLSGQAREDVDHDTYGDRVLQLLGLLSEHEQAETTLWQSALWTDVGAGD